MPENPAMVAEAMLAALSESLSAGDSNGVAELCWLQDERFGLTVQGETVPLHPGAELRLRAWLDARVAPGDHAPFAQTLARRLADDVIYLTTGQKRGAVWLRLTLILLKIGVEWGIVYAHISCAPTEGQAASQE